MPRLLLIVALCTGLPLTVAEAQRGEFGRMRRMLGDPNEYYEHPEFRGNVPYDGRFTFVRIKYRGFGGFTNQGPGWSHDYPRAETNLMRIMQEITSLRPFIESPLAAGGNVLALDDPELMKFPIAYFSEPGYWQPTEQEVLGFRNYLTKGGFVIFDDFQGPQHWMNFTFQMQRVLPGARVVPLDQSHQIFDAFFKVDLSLLHTQYNSRPVYYGIYQENDPKKRLIAIINFENDVGEYWEYSNRGFAPIPVSNEAYKLGVNYLIYALTH
ncbi:MAG: DUF4159 domain-containing protein [Gemmatimonadaceae bacterium]